MNNETPTSFLDYQKLLKRAWDTWQENLGKSFSSGSANSGMQEQAERALSGLKAHLELMERMNMGFADETGDWKSSLGDVFGNFSANPFMQAYTEAVDLAGGGPQAWAQSTGASQPPWFATWKDMLGMPAFGPGREQQERDQALAKAWSELHTRQMRYQALLAKVARMGVDRLESRLAERAEPGRQIEQMRELYNLWVDAAEEAYQEVALSPQWRQTYGDLVNAQMQVRTQMQDRVERLAREWGMPTRSEVDTLGQRLQALRRELRATRKILDEIRARPTPAEPVADSSPVLRKSPAARKSPATRKNPAATKVSSTGEGAKRASPGRHTTASKQPASSRKNDSSGISTSPRKTTATHKSPSAMSRRSVKGRQ